MTRREIDGAWVKIQLYWHYDGWFASPSSPLWNGLTVTDREWLEPA